jgi:biofilm PGA synthesis N-glycosyltransferase PgaC
LRKHVKTLFSWKSRRMWIVALELTVSTLWAYIISAVFLLWTLGQLFDLPPPFSAASIPPSWTGVVLGTTCLLQFALSLAIDSRYEKRLGRVYYWLIWYPMIYWVIQVSTSLFAVPRAIARPKGTRGIWKSPDRGVQRPPEEAHE